MREFRKCLYERMSSEGLYEIADEIIKDSVVDLKAAAFYLGNIEWELQFEKDRR